MAKGTRLELVIIDPQNDFCNSDGALFVKGADEDSARLATMIKRLLPKWDDIHVTLDSHRIIDVAHPIFWKDGDGNHPAPYTQITAGDVMNGTYRPTNPSWMDRAKDYVNQLEKNGKYPLVIWPEHCLIGGWGHSIVSEVLDSLRAWERETFSIVDFVTKGSNVFTEHYSGIQADVPDPKDPTTQLNMELVKTLENSDIVAITGEALSHCVANTVRDIANEFGDENIKKLVLIEDTTSSVEGFEQMGEDFIKEMTGRGMQTAKSTDFLV